MRRLFRRSIVAQLGGALDLVALVADPDARLIIGKIVDAAVNVFINDRARLQECLLDVLGRLRRRLHKDESVLASEHLTLIGADLSARVQVALIAD